MDAARLLTNELYRNDLMRIVLQHNVYEESWDANGSAISAALNRGSSTETLNVIII